MWFLSPRPCAFLALLPFVLVKCARFRDGELNPTSIKEVGLSCGGSKQPLVNDVMIDSPTDHIADLVRSFAELGYYSRVEEIRCVEYGVPHRNAAASSFEALCSASSTRLHRQGGPRAPFLRPSITWLLLESDAVCFPILVSRAFVVSRSIAAFPLVGTLSSVGSRVLSPLGMRLHPRTTNDALRLRLPDGSVRSFTVPEVPRVAPSPPTAGAARRFPRPRGVATAGIRSFP